MIKCKIDPRTKIIIVLILSAFALLYNDVFILTGILLISTFVASILNSDFISVLFRLKKLIKLIIAVAVVQSIFINTGKPIVKLGNFTLITDYGIYKALEFILRLSIIIVSASIITTSTSREIVQGLVQMHCPYEIAFMVSVSLRFLPIFKEEMTDMVTAIQLRGVDLKEVKLNQKIKVYKYILMPITINSMLKARELASAMEMRAFRAYPKRSSYMVLKMKSIDYIVIGVSLFLAGSLVIIMSS